MMGVRMRSNLLSNPFNCNCHLEWLASWLKAKNLVTSDPRCFYPERFRNYPVTDLKSADFKCESTARSHTSPIL